MLDRTPATSTDPDRLPERRGARATPASRSRSGSTSPASSSRPWSPQRAVDWSNSLLLSCRFTAWRDGEFNEYVYNFFKSLSRERMRRAEAEVVRKLTPVDVLETLDEPDIRIGDYVVQRRCPHRNADLAAFGEIDGCEFVCTLHGWRFDLETGRNKTASDQPLRIRRRRLPPH